LFTGIIESRGTIAQVRSRGQGLELHVLAQLPGGPLVPGESIAVSGPCLTVEKVVDGGFVVFASAETTARTTIGSLARGDRVNLERAMAASGRFGGHMVTGHIDGIGRLVQSQERGEATGLEFQVGSEISRFIVARGSISIDGISLTVTEADAGRFKVVVIPHTLSNTTLDGIKPGASVNVEVDIVARYIFAFTRPSDGGITAARLAELGWDVGD